MIILNMRTFEEFKKQMIGAHICEKCKGKIIGITIDLIGNQYCTYCGERINYPQATFEEILNWIGEKEKNEKNIH